MSQADREARRAEAAERFKRKRAADAKLKARTAKNKKRNAANKGA